VEKEEKEKESDEISKEGDQPDGNKGKDLPKD
jgi:hypothetical protein